MVHVYQMQSIISVKIYPDFPIPNKLIWLLKVLVFSFDLPPYHHKNFLSNLVPRVFSLSNMAAAGDKTLAHSRNHVTELSTESGNLFKMAAKIKSERIWVRGLETGEKQTKWRQRQNSKEAKNMKEYTYKPQEYGRMI